MTSESRPVLARKAFRRLSVQSLAITGVYSLVLAMSIVWGLVYKIPGPESPIKPWMLIAAIAGAAAAIGAVVTLAIGWRRAGPSRMSGFCSPIIACVIVLAVCAAVLEVATRVIARPHPLGSSIGSKVLVPYDWAAVKAFNKALLERSRKPASYYVESRELGWTIGPSRRSSNGMYLSSAEGLRSARQGEELLSTAPASRIAIFGDSFAFSEEVPFEQSLNVHLEGRLGGGTQVLTFGVPGYGIGQAVLRFEQEAARWKPDVSMLQFITDDINRIGNIYLFNKPNWAYPFVKPRFVLRQDGLQQVLLPSADEVFARASVFDLPHLELDSEFDKYDWLAFPLSTSHALRFVAALSPRAAPEQPLTNPSLNEQLAVSLIERFVAGARAIGSVPIVVFFPDASNFNGDESPSSQRVISALAARGIDVVDPSACMRAAGGVKELIVGGGRGKPPVATATVADIGVGEIDNANGVHYSNAGNARMAHCLAPLLEQRLANRTSVQTNR